MNMSFNQQRTRTEGSGSRKFLLSIFFLALVVAFPLNASAKSTHTAAGLSGQTGGAVVCPSKIEAVTPAQGWILAAQDDEEGNTDVAPSDEGGEQAPSDDGSQVDPSEGDDQGGHMMDDPSPGGDSDSGNTGGDDEDNYQHQGDEDAE
jgi:hypothetical protein